jgi:hypothetical protein
MTREGLFTWIASRVSTRLEVSIEGERTRAPKEIARFLYRLGFIVARSENDEGKYEHYRFDQMPDFLQSRTDHDFGIKVGNSSLLPAGARYPKAQPVAPGEIRSSTEEGLNRTERADDRP